MKEPELYVSGTVRGLQTRTEVSGGGNGFSASSTTILVFRLEPLDGSRPVNVQLRGSRLDGTVVDGEVVDVSGRMTAPGVIEAVRIVSRETGTALEAPTVPKGCGYAVFAFMVLVFLAAIAIFVFIAVTA